GARLRGAASSGWRIGNGASRDGPIAIRHSLFAIRGAEGARRHPMRRAVLRAVVVLLLAGGLHAVRVPPAGLAQRVTCASFPNQSAAQSAYRENPARLHHLDPERTGFACSSLPCPCDPMPVRPVADLSGALLTLDDLPPGWAEAPAMTMDGGGGPGLCGRADGGQGDDDGDEPQVRFRRGPAGAFVSE